MKYQAMSTEGLDSDVVIKDSFRQMKLLIKEFKAVYSVKTKTKANLSRKHWLNYWHRCNHRCKRRLMHEIDTLAFNFNHTTVYAHIVIACDEPKISMCAKFSKMLGIVKTMIDF